MTSACIGIIIIIIIIASHNVDLSLSLYSTTNQPLHSTKTTLLQKNMSGSDDSWICDTGYFKSTPTLITGSPTCRTCTPIGAGCRVGWQLTPCTPMADVACTPCADAPIGQVYFRGGDCLDTTCAEGWAFSSDICIPCPIGFYCSGRERDTSLAIPCGENCTTSRKGTISSLECIQSEGKDEMAFVVQYTFSLVAMRATASPIVGTSSATNTSSISALIVGLEFPTCPSLNEFTTSWLKYGTLQTCSLMFISQTWGTLSCTISTAQCIAGKYYPWLLNSAILNQESTAAKLATCLQLAGISTPLVLGSPIIQQGSLLSLSASSQQQQQQTGFLISKKVGDAPLLHIEPRKWGDGRDQTLATLLAVFVVMWCLALTLMCSYAAFFLKGARHKKSTSSLFDHIFKTHAKKLHKKSADLEKNSYTM